jgi:hypothetical protein
VGADGAVQYRLTIVPRDPPGALPVERVVAAGTQLTIGAAGADLPLGDPYGRPVYCQLDAESDGLRVRCFSEARGAWVYVPPAEERGPLTVALRATHFDAGVRDPNAPDRLWVRTRAAVRALDARRATRLAAGALADAVIPRFGLVLLPAGSITVERLAGGATRATDTAARAGSALQSPFVAHGLRPSLERRVREVTRLAELEPLLDGVLLECDDDTVRRVGGGEVPAGPWLLPSNPPGGAQPSSDLAEVIAVSSESYRADDAAPAVSLYEVPLMLRQGSYGTEPYALLVAQPRGTPERALLYRLRSDAMGRDLGDVIAERFAQLAEPTLEPAWHTTALPGGEPWQAPRLALWAGLEPFLDALLARVPVPASRAAERVWQDLQVELERALDQHPSGPDAVLEAASRLAWQRRDLELAGLVAHETLRRRLHELTAARAVFRRLEPAQLVDLTELSAMALNCGLIGDDNRQKLLNRLAHLLLLFAPSEPDGRARTLLLPSGCLVVLDAAAVEAHERWARAAAARRGDRRLLESIAAPLDVLDHARAQLARWGFPTPEDRFADAVQRVQAMLA